MGIVEKFIKEGQLTKEEYPELLHLYQDPDAVRLLREEAVRIQKKYFGNKIYTRGLIEFTNYCRNDCYYCGIRRSNRNASRYRLTKEEILQCCENGYELGFRTFVLQGGEDPWFNDDRMVAIIRPIKQGYPDCAITLSIGEKSKESYQRFKDAATGKTLVEAGSYHRIASSPLNPLKIPSAIYTGIVKSASTITFMLIIGGAFQVITSTGALTALCKKLSKTFSKHKYVVIPVFLTLFSIFGFTMGMSSEVMIFVPIGITLALFLGLDKVTGTAMIALGAAVGFTAGLLNPFNVGVAQDIAELQLFSGMAY